MSKTTVPKSKVGIATDSEIEQFAKEWVAPFVARSAVGKFSGGVLHPRTMANIDSRGEGPEKSFVCGRVVYTKPSLVEWMKAKTKKGEQTVKPRLDTD